LALAGNLTEKIAISSLTIGAGKLGCGFLATVAAVAVLASTPACYNDRRHSTSSEIKGGRIITLLQYGHEAATSTAVLIAMWIAIAFAAARADCNHQHLIFSQLKFPPNLCPWVALGKSL
jgi:hypothetical protein